MTKKYTDIGNRFKQLRGKKSQTKFAKEIGTTLRAYQYYESGDRVPHIHLLTKIANLNNTTTDWLLTGKVDIEKNRMHEASKRTIYMTELLDLLEKSLEREEKLIYKYCKGRAEAEGGELIHKEENEFVGFLRKLIDEQQPSENIIHLTEDSPLYIMYKQLERIREEGNKEKIQLIEGMLKQLDPGMCNE